MPTIFFETEPISGAYFRSHFVSPWEGTMKNAAIKETGFVIDRTALDRSSLLRIEWCWRMIRSLLGIEVGGKISDGKLICVMLGVLLLHN
jgi:hypothetical protein